MPERCGVLRRTDGFACNCVDGFAGDVCDEDVDVCWYWELDQTYTRSVRTPGLVPTSANATWGTQEMGTCEDLDECASTPCQNGNLNVTRLVDYYNATLNISWSENVTVVGNQTVGPEACEESESDESVALLSYTCECRDGFEGNDRSVASDDCRSQPCLNNGICRMVLDRPTCLWVRSIQCARSLSNASVRMTGQASSANTSCSARRKWRTYMMRWAGCPSPSPSHYPNRARA